LVDALDNLYRHDGNAVWLDRVDRALVWLHDKKRDPNGHYGLFWGRNGPQVGALNSWNLNEQAAIARAFLYTNAVPEPPTIGLVIASVSLFVCCRRRILGKERDALK
jgi:hypothetical protein